jgi:carbon-monoxide dehydrogenase medium subunit
VALGGELVVRGPTGARRLAAADLATAPFETRLDHGELVVEVVVPLAPGPHGAAFCEWAPRHHDRAEAGVGVTVSAAGGDAVASARAAACGVGSGPVDLTAVVDDALRGEPADRDPSDALVRHLAGAIGGTCREHGADDDRTALAGALGARAALRAMRDLAGAITREAA